MNAEIQSIKGMNDILPSETPCWDFVENALRAVAHSYGYQEIRFPLVERTALFQRAIGEVTDVVEKEMYTFLDRNGDSLSLRPEGTAGCVRAGIQNGLIYNKSQRLWYIGQMFRYERPQKGRYRQFHQFGVEVFGLPGPDVDAELMLMLFSLWRKLGIDKKLSLQISNIGTKNVRAVYRKDLTAYFSLHINALDEDSKRRLLVNPLRILDSKNPELQQIISKAPNLLDYLDDESRDHFDKLKRILDATKINYVVNSRLVRGLDYYCQTVFEWITDFSGAQNAVCGGGRYDYLVEQLGGKPTPAVGFALGLERLVKLVVADKILVSVPDVYLIMVGDSAELVGLNYAEKLRQEFPKLSIITNCGGGSFKSQFKHADKSLAKVALIIGDEEVAQNKITLKHLRIEMPQKVVNFSELIKILPLVLV